MNRNIILMLCAVAALGVPRSLSAQGGFNGPGAYEILNVKSGKVLDLDRNDQTTVIQFSSRQTNNQVWIASPADSGYFYLRNAMNGNALDATSNRNSALVRGTPFTGSPSQQWRVDSGKDGNALIVNRNGKGLDIPDGSDRDGLKVQIYDVNGDSNQRFTLRRVQGNYGSAWGGTAGGSQNGRRGRIIDRPGQFGNAGNAAARITCSSDSGNRVYCQADTSGGVRMVRQLSGSACNEGQTWGYDRRGVWVDRGCRAEFETGGSQEGYSGGSSASRITCSSESGRRVRCNANTSGGVRLIRQLGGSCVQNSTWGWDSNSIWVDRGCRAEFEVRR